MSCTIPLAHYIGIGADSTLLLDALLSRSHRRATARRRGGVSAREVLEESMAHQGRALRQRMVRPVNDFMTVIS